MTNFVIDLTRKKGKQPAIRWYQRNGYIARARVTKWIRDNYDKHKVNIRNFRRRHPGIVAKWAREYRRKFPEKIADIKHRRRAREKIGIDCRSKIRNLLRETSCRWCHRFIEQKDRTIDHVIPLFRGGLHHPDNLVMACSRCNKSKGSKLVEEWIPTIR